MHSHGHYFGQAQSFEILEPSDFRYEQQGDVTILKSFFIDDTVNMREWKATWEGLKKDAEDIPGIPLVLQEDLEHPTFSVQKYYERGTIFDYDIDEENHRIIVYIRITDPEIAERIKSGELQYVSPAVIPRGDEYLSETEEGIDVLERTVPLHLAIVANPAYGRQKALMSHICSGNGRKCYDRLKTMTASAAKLARETEDDCVSKKIPIILKENSKMSQDQAAAIAYSMCSSTASVTGPLEQIPFLKKKIAAGLARTASMLEKTRYNMKHAIHHGREGTWIKAKGMDVFVAKNQKPSEALKCGCTAIDG